MNTRNFSFGAGGVFRLQAVGWVLALMCVSLVGARAQAPAGSRAARVNRAVDVVQQWQPQQHLYVKGNPGAGDEALDALEQWLAANATNWVVVLAEHAQDETFTDAAGESFQGVEAVNQALGKGLMNQTAFGQLQDARTGERNAAFFLLFLKERNLSYYGSDAQDRRGLGEENWIGNLDRPAIAAMRDGARVVDAVKDTITSINTKLDQRIAAEAAARKKQAADQLAARNRATEQARAALANAQSDYNLLEAKSGELARRHEGTDGDLAMPNLPRLAAELKLAQTAFDQGDPAAALRGAETMSRRAQEIIRAINQYRADQELIEGLQRQLESHQRQRYAHAAANQLQAARDAVAAARQQHQRGDSSYVPLLEAASRTVASAGSAVRMAERMAEQRRVLVLMSVIAMGLLAGVLGLVLNRRRSPARNEARQLYALWEKALGEKTSALFALLDRRATIIGTSAAEAAARFRGQTLRLCEQIIHDVDELFILSACAGRVLQQANDEVNPGEALRKLLNLFRRGPYQRVIALLKDQPIAFRPEEGLELVVRGARTERDRLIGSVESYQPFTMTFNELIDTFNQHAERALNALDRVESSLLKAPEEFQAVQQQIDAARAAEQQVGASVPASPDSDPRQVGASVPASPHSDPRQVGASVPASPHPDHSADLMFRLAPVFDELLPAAQQALSDALAKGLQDPVGALENEGARARRQTEDATALVALGTKARQNTIPAARECAAALEKSGLDPAWLDADLADLSSAADEAAMLACRGSAQTEIQFLTQALEDLEQRSRRAMALDEARSGPAREQIRQSTTAINQARGEIGASLGLAPGEVLREDGKDPTDYVTQAGEQWESAFAALERGDLEATQNSLDAVRALTTEADAIVAASREAFRSHSESLKSLHKELEELTALIPERARILAEIKGGYAVSVLALGAGDPAHPNANGTLADNIQEAEAHMAEIRRLLEISVAHYREAKLLEAVDQLQQAKGLLDMTRHRLLEIAEKKTRLETAVSANTRQLGALENRARQCAALADEPTSMAPTLQVFAEAGRALANARAAVQASPGDPFLAGTLLAEAEARYTTMADMARCDRDLYEQAGRSLAAAAGQVTEAGSLAERTATDNIPDSAAIHQACAEVGSLNATLRELRAQHQAAHGNWPALDQAANQLAQHAARAAATLRGELDRAAATLAMLGTASSSVRNAGGWIGDFGVSIIGTPGSEVLSQANAHLQRGEYDLAFRLAEQARGIAERAVAQAHAEVMRRRRAEEERRERERRRRQAEEEARRRRSSSFGSGSIGSTSRSSSRSSSWGSSGSGARTSSFRSGSGVRTSSW